MTKKSKRKAEEPSATESVVARKRQQVDTSAVILSFKKLLEGKQPSVSASFNADMQPMETGLDSLSVTQDHFTAQLEPMETNHGLVETCRPVKITFGDRADSKRPIASTVGVLEEPSMVIKTPVAEQAVTCPVMKPATPPVMHCSMVPNAKVCNENLQGMECSMNELAAALGKLQLKPDVSNVLDFKPDDDCDQCEYDLGLGEQVILIIELLTGKELPSE